MLAFGCTGLAKRISLGERIELFAYSHDAIDGRDVSYLDLEDAHHHDNAGQADVGHCRRIAMAESARIGFGGQTLFQRLQAGREPVNLSVPPRSIVEVAGSGEVFLDARNNQRLGIGGQHGRQ